jgi:uncharacterized membrane protein YbhN (UPF0104 family)
VTIVGLTRKLLISVGFGILVVFGLSFAADAPRLLHVLARFDWTWLPLIIGLTLVNYGLRFVKWHYYLGVVGVRGITLRQSALIFTTGLSMVITPGKVGELLKAYLLRYHRGTPIGTGAPIIVAERLTDGIALVLLASGGLILYRVGWELLLPIAGAMVVAVVVARHEGPMNGLLGAARRLPLLAPQLHHLEDAVHSARQLFEPRRLLLAIGIGLLSWSGEVLAFFLVLTALGLPSRPMLVVQAAFILAIATLVGAASMLPGGLAAADGSLAGLLLLVGVTHDPSVAAAATLIIRFCTLWLGVLVGLVGLALTAGQLAGQDLAVSA